MKTWNRLQFSALTLVLATSFAAFAETTASPAAQDGKEPQSPIAALLDIKNEKSEVHKSFSDNFGTQQELQSRVDEAVESIKADLISELHKQKLCIPLDVGQSLKSLIKIPFKVKVKGQRCVEPTNVSGQMLLTDSFEGEIRTLSIFKGRTLLRITFQKVFDGQDSQMGVLKSKVPYWADIPTNPDEVVNKLAPGQTIRLEFEGELGAENILDDTVGHLRNTGGIGYSRTGQFIVDLYRQNETDVITRFTGIINRGRWSANGGLDWRMLGGIAGRILHGGFIGEALSASIGGNGERSAFDTMMAVYRFNMASDTSRDAKDALSEIFGNMRRFSFVKPFLHQIRASQTEEEDFAQELLKQASKAEQFANQDKDLPHDQQRVEHKFRGRLITKILKVKPLEGHASIAAAGKLGFSSSTTDVRKYDRDNKLDFYAVENLHTYADGQLGNGKYSRGGVSDIDLLAKADTHGNPGQYLDLVKRNEYQEGEFDQENLASYREKIRRKVPLALASDADIEAVLPKQTQNSGTLVIETNIGTKGLAALQGEPGSYFALAFQRFMERKGYPMPPLAEGQQGNYLNEKGYDLAKLFDTLDQNTKKHSQAEIDAKNAAAFETFARLKKDDDFRGFIMSEFLPTMLPQDQLSDMMSVNVSFTSNETHGAGKTFGKAKMSDVYQAVRFMRKILEQEGNDLNLRLDEVSQGKSVK